MLLAITVVGIPLALLGAVAFGFGLWIGAIDGQFAIAAWALERAGVAIRESLGRRWLALVVGLGAFKLLGRVPILGRPLELIALLLGLGGMLFGLRTAYRNRSERPSRETAQTTLDQAGGGVSADD